MKAIYKIVILALTLRLLVSFLGWHGDVLDFYWWTKDLVANGLFGFYDRYIANATQPIYPPVTSYLFWFAGLLHESFLKFLWFLNINIALFPSNLIFWMESREGWIIFNKLPAIFSDIGITYTLYVFGRAVKNEKAGLVAASLFAFTPVFWYNSSLWGQTESIFALPMILAFFLLYKNKVKASMVVFTLAVLTKPTALFSFPVFIFWLLAKRKWREILMGLTFSFVLILLLYFPFHPQNLVNWIISFYIRSLNGVLGYTVANAFNFWALIFGFDNRPDTSLLLGIPAVTIGRTVFLFLITVLGLRLFRKKDSIWLILILAAIISFSAFMLLSRMHERYFYPTLIFLIPIAAYDKKIRNVFLLASSIHLVNLYHFWWVPKINFLISLFSSPFIEKLLILTNIATFFYLITVFQKYYAKAK